MKYFLVMLLAALFALPSFAQTGIDNCCQVGRACSADDEWVKGYYDYLNGLCPAPNMSMSQPLQRDGYTFVGSGKTKSQIIRLSPGKWNLQAALSRPAWIFISEVHESGEVNTGGNCLTWNSWWNWYGYSTFDLEFWSGWRRGQFIARTNCLAALHFYYHTSYNPENETYKFYLNKVDGNF